MAMAIRVFLLSLLFLYISFADHSFSLYEDQAGLMDWHQQYIGKVKRAVFHTQKTGKKRVVVSTEENVLASLDLRHGQIFWRRVLGANDAIDGVDIVLGKYVITLSSEGSILRAWSLPDGQMVWESFLQGSKPSKSLLSVPINLTVDKDNVILVFGKGCLHAVSSIDGVVLWKKDFSAESIEVRQIIQPLGNDKIYVVGFVGSSQFDVYQINAKNGELIKHASAAFPDGFLGEVLSVSSDMLVSLDSTKSILVTINFQNGEISFKKTHISDFVEDHSGIADILPSKLSGVFAVKINTLLVFIRVTAEGVLEVVDKINNAAAVSDALSFSEGQQAFALVEHVDGKVLLTLKCSHDWNNDLLKESVEVGHQRGLVHKLKKPSHPSRGVPTAISCLAVLLKEPMVRSSFVQADGVKLLIPLISPASTQQSIQVVRVVVLTLRNLLSKAASGAQMIDHGLPQIVQSLKAQAWSDEDLLEGLNQLEEGLKDKIKKLSSSDKYKQEVLLGQLDWSPMHEDNLFGVISMQAYCRFSSVFLGNNGVYF